MSITWSEIVAIYLSQPWWVWIIALGLVWFGAKWLYRAANAYAERPVITATDFRQCRVSVDFQSGTISLPRGHTYPVSHIRGLRWEDYSKSGSFHAYIEVDDLANPTHPVSFSTWDGPEKFVGRLRTAIEKAGGVGFSAATSDRIDLIERDFSNPITAAIATRIAGHGHRVSYSRSD